MRYDASTRARSSRFRMDTNDPLCIMALPKPVRASNDSEPETSNRKLPTPNDEEEKEEYTKFLDSIDTLTIVTNNHSALMFILR